RDGPVHNARYGGRGKQKVLAVGALGGELLWLARNGCSCRYRWGYCFAMARGNQRELARQKNMKKTQEQNKGKRKEDALSASQRKQRDSEIMQQKQKAADEKKSLQGGAK
ncbi:small EDRK-rich factor 1-like, partial [Eublepharis macularius]|uniref:Small EDRK-rich factor 1-like n=1 Tax=Eublepharis macularius TaxID=481883 RepID=A0AA97JQP9_EUBMA